MNEVDERILKKWDFLIQAGKNYWIDNNPTGMDDATFDAYEIQAAREDNFFVRDYILDKYSKGAKKQNADYIGKIQKFKVEGSTMLQAIIKTADELGIPYEELFIDPKYDGSSIAIYIDPTNGKPLSEVTVGNTNLGNLGVDQTWKLNKLLPKQFPLGIKAVQCEALIDVDRLNDVDPEKARQKANGLINSKYLDGEVANLLTLRAFRYFVDETSYFGQELLKKSYREVLGSFQIRTSRVDGHITFAPAQVWTLKELIDNGGDVIEHDRMRTPTGLFLADGVVLYNKQGICQRALKFAGAGSGTEAIKTTVRSIQWNDQCSKGKDSWSANVIVDPVVIKGCTVKKPSAGSVAKLIKNNITEGAEVGIILANSTIPMVGDVFKPGNGNYQWPVCECGYTLGEKDIYGSLIKCGNPMCSERLGRMRNYLDELNNIKTELDLNSLLVIDRFRWENTTISIPDLLRLVKENKKQEYHDYLDQYLKTKLQKRNLELVWEASYTVLYERRTFY